MEHFGGEAYARRFVLRAQHAGAPLQAAGGAASPAHVQATRASRLAPTNKGHQRPLAAHGLQRSTRAAGAASAYGIDSASPQRLFARASLARGLGVADSPVRAESAPGRRAPHRVVLSECNPARHPHACFSLSSLKHRLQLDRTWCSVGGRVAPRPARTGAQSQQARAPQAEHAALPHRLVRAQHRRVPDHEVLVAVGARAASATERPAPWNK